MKPISKKILSIIARVTTFVVLLGGTGFGAYMLTPKKKVAIEQSTTSSISKANPLDENTYFGKLYKKVSRSLDENDDEAITGLSIDLDNVEITWPNATKTYTNDVVVDGLINLSLNGLKNLDVTIDLSANYNSKTVDLALGLVDSTIYFSLQDLNIKSSNSSTEEFISVVEELFFDENNPNGLGIGLDIGGIFDSLLEGLDLGGFNLSGLDVTETVIDDEVDIAINLAGIIIHIYADTETIDIKRVDLGTISVGDVTIGGQLICTSTENFVVRGFDDPLYNGKKRTNFVELVNYVGWADRLFNLFDSRTMGLNLSADLSLDNGESVDKLTHIDANVNVDASALLDIRGININELIFPTAETTNNKETTNLVDTLLDGLTFTADLSAEGQVEEEYANMSLGYVNRAGYLSLNENNEDAVMRAKIDVADVSAIIDMVPEFLSSITDDSEANEDAAGLFDFVTSSELVTAIKDGMYDGIIDMIKTIKNTNNTIELEVSLDSLGFGEQSTIKLILDASEDAVTSGNKVIMIEIKNTVVGSLHLDLTLSTTNYSTSRMDKIISNSSKYDDMHFAVGVFDQVVDLVKTRKAYFDLGGSILDGDGLGFKFDGWAQFDYNSMYGYGSARFDEYKTSSTKISATHTVDIDVDNSSDNPSSNNMLFEYRDKLKGKFTIQTMDDLIELIKQLINKNDPRFTKFLDPIKQILLGGMISNIIDSKDYIAFAKPTFVKSITQNADKTALNIVIAKEVLSLSNDIVLGIEFGTKNENSIIKKITISGLAIGGKDISLFVGVSDYDESITTPVDKADPSVFYDFSDICVLLEFGIDSTELNVYHLTAPINLTFNIIKFDIISFNLDFYIVVDGVSTKVYGKIPSVPLKLGTTSAEFVFEPSRNASGNDVGGYFHILRVEDHVGSLSDASYYYRCESSQFVPNILGYLLKSILDLPSIITNLIGDAETSTVEDSNYEDIILENGFKYTVSGNTHVWDLGLNLGCLIGSDLLGDATIKLTGKETASGQHYLNTAKINMNVAKDAFTVKGTITLDEPTEATDFPTNIGQRYNSIIGIFNNMSASQQESFVNDGYMNNPDKAYKLKYIF